MTIQPVKNRDVWASPLVGVLQTTMSAYYDQIPLKRPKVAIERDSSALEKALVAGTVVLRSGKFTGTFSAAISKELRGIGATFSAKLSAWYLSPHLVPAKIARLAQKVQDSDAGWMARVQSAAAKAAPVSIIAAIALPGIYRAIASQVAKAVSTTTGREVIPQTTYDDGNVFAMTVEESIKGFSEKETKRIASIIRQAEGEQWSADRLEKTLVGRMGVAADRAKTMARQGMAIAATDLKAGYYIQAGLPKYRWQTQEDGRVRSAHEALNGVICDWNNPPLANPAAGIHAHPGQDYNCRCVATPLNDWEIS